MPTAEKAAMKGSTYGNKYGVYGSSSSKSIVPSEVISGVFMKNGVIILPELKEELKPMTIVIDYGKSGRKDHGFGYSIEVTIQLLDAANYELICCTTSEGMGDTETDDVRKAIDECLEAIFK